MRKFIDKYILETIIIILLILLVIVVIYRSEQQRIAYTQNEVESEPKIEICMAESSPVETIMLTREILVDVINDVELEIAPEPIPTPKPIPLYDIALSEELQEYAYNICQEYGVEYETVLAIAFVESSYNENTVGSQGELSIMQIHPVNFKWLQKELGVLDFYNAKHSILAGVYMLAGLQEKFDDISSVLIGYNAGQYAAKRMINRGINKTKYSIKVQRVRDQLIREGGI